MGHHFRIRVYGTQRKNIDPALLAQVVILLGRHLQQRQQANHQDTAPQKSGQDPSASLRRGNPRPVDSSSQDISRTPTTDADHGAGGGVGEGLS
jgi:hypothetical protein